MLHGPLAVVALLMAMPAHAKDVVLYSDGTAEAAVDLVTRSSGVSPNLLDPIHWSALVQDKPAVLVGDGDLEDCGETFATTDVLAAIGRAEADLQYVRYEQALMTLDEAASAVWCANAPIDPKEASRLHFLRGVTQIELGIATAADASFRLAGTYEPAMRWDDDFKPTGKDQFEAAIAGLLADPGAVVDVLGHPGEGMLWIDGVEVPSHQMRIRLTTGTHTLQYGSPLRPSSLTVEEGTESELLFASAGGGLTGLLQESKRQELSALLASEFGSGKRVYVVDDDGVAWRGIAGDDVFAPFRGGFGPYGSAGFQLSELRVEEEQGRAARDAGVAVTVGGGAAAVTGLVLAGVGFAKASSAGRDISSVSSPSDFHDAQRQRSTGLATGWVGLSVGAVGGTMFGIGLSQAVSATPMPLWGGGGVRLTVSP